VAPPSGRQVCPHGGFLPHNERKVGVEPLERLGVEFRGRNRAERRPDVDTDQVLVPTARGLGEISDVQSFVDRLTTVMLVFGWRSLSICDCNFVRSISAAAYVFCCLAEIPLLVR